MFTVELDLTERSRNMIRQMPDLVNPAIYKGMKEAMIIADATARGHYLSGVALQRRTGRLRASINTRVIIAGDRVIGRIGTNVVYARIHELGGVILPKTAQALKFQIPGVGWRTVKKVTMPARPFLRPSLSDNLQRFRDLFARNIEEAFEGI